jgi:hypothetical protein
MILAAVTSRAGAGEARAQLSDAPSAGDAVGLVDIAPTASIGSFLAAPVSHAALVTQATADSAQIKPGLRTFLEPNAPNPFQFTTRIAYTISQETHVVLRVYDFYFNEVETLVDEVQAAGRHIVDWDPEGTVSSGMYFYELRTNDQTELGRMLYVR